MSHQTFTWNKATWRIDTSSLFLASSYDFPHFSVHLCKLLNNLDFDRDGCDSQRNRYINYRRFGDGRARPCSNGHRFWTGDTVSGRKRRHRPVDEIAAVSFW